MNKFYETKVKKLSGTSYSEVYTKAKYIFNNISEKTKRRPYIRSSFFNKEKIFIDHFWDHLMEKNRNDRFRRLKFYSCAIDLMQNSHIKPISKDNPNRKDEILHRFTGITSNNEIFHIQVKENKKNSEKVFMSVFP